MDLLELVKDSPNSKLSSSRVWFNIANLAATAAYCYTSYKAANYSPVNLEGLAWYTLVYMGVVTSNKFANKFVEKKYGNTEQKISG